MSSIAETVPAFSLPVQQVAVERARPGADRASAGWMLAALFVSTLVWLLPVIAWLALR